MSSVSWCLQSSHVRARCTRSLGWLTVWAFYVRAWLMGCAGVAGPPGPPPPPPSGITLYPSWPASSPWVTAVGATRFINQDPTGAAGEMATDQFGSGGGFSTLWAQSPNATWQTAAVQAYLKADAGDLPPAGSFPPNGRGTPDVSALGEGFQVGHPSVPYYRFPPCARGWAWYAVADRVVWCEMWCDLIW